MKRTLLWLFTVLSTGLSQGTLQAVEDFQLPPVNVELTYLPFNPFGSASYLTITLPNWPFTWLETLAPPHVLFQIGNPTPIGAPQVQVTDNQGRITLQNYSDIDGVSTFIYADDGPANDNRRFGLVSVRLNSNHTTNPGNPGVFDIFLTDAATGAKVSGATVNMVAFPAAPIPLTEVGLGQYRTVVFATESRDFAITRSGYNAKLFTTTVTAGAFASFNQTLVNPTPATVSVNTSANNPTGANPIPVDFFFSKPVNPGLGDFTISDLVVTNGVVGSLDGEGQTYTAQVIPNGPGAVTVSLPANAVRDGGNIGNALSNTLSVTYDATGPTVTIDQAPAQSDPATTYPVRFAVHFSETVTGFAAGDVELGGTAGIPLVASVSGTGTGTDYVVEVFGMSAPGTVIASIRADAASGFSGPSRESTATDNVVQWSPPSNYTLATKFARLDYSGASSPAEPSETVNLDLGANAWVVLPPRSPGHTNLMQVVGSANGPEITAPETAVTSTSTGRVRIGAHFLTTDTSDFFTYALTPPGTANRQYGFAHLTMINLSDLATVVGGAYVVLTDGTDRIRGATLTYGSTAESGAPFTEMTAGVYRITVSNSTTGTIFARAAGFLDAAQSQNLTVGVFTEIPLTLTPSELISGITSSIADPTRSKTFPVTFTFSSLVSDFTAGDVKVTNGTFSAFAGSGSTYTGTITAKKAGTVKVEIASGAATASSFACNAAALTRTYDPKGPLVTINQAIGQADPVISGPILFTAQFTAPVTGFTGADVSFSGSTSPGTMAAVVTGSGTTYTISVSGMVGDGTVRASLAADAAFANGHPSAASTSSDNTVTFTPPGVGSPSVTINQDAGQPDPTPLAAAVFRVHFSNPVNGFTAADVQLSGSAPGTLSKSVSSVGSAGTEFIVLVGGMTGPGTVIASLPAGVATAQAGSQPTFAGTSSDNQVTYAPVGGSGSTPSASSGSGACGLGSGLAALLVGGFLGLFARRSLR